MAPKTAVRPLSQEAVEELVATSSQNKFLPTIVLPSGAGDSSSVDNVTIVAVVYIRLGGFLILVPSDPGVHACLLGLELELGLDPAAFHPCSVTLISGRGNEIGIADVELVDLPWGAVSAFFSASSLKSKFKQSNVTHFTVGVKIGSPLKENVPNAADQWIASKMNAQVAQEYQTAEEENLMDAGHFGDAEEAPEEEPAEAPAAQPPVDVAGLQQRIVESQSAASSSFAGDASTSTIEDNPDVWVARDLRPAASRGLVKTAQPSWRTAAQSICRRDSAPARSSPSGHAGQFIGRAREGGRGSSSYWRLGTGTSGNFARPAASDPDDAVAAECCLAEEACWPKTARPHHGSLEFRRLGQRKRQWWAFEDA